MNFEVAKGFHLIGNSFYGEGGGRYLGALGPDVIVKPDGTLSPVRSGSAIFGYEWQATPKLIVDGYYSGAYFWRNYRTAASGFGSVLRIAVHVLRGLRIPRLGEYKQQGLSGSHDRIRSDHLVQPELRQTTVYLAVFLRGSCPLVCSGWQP